MDPGFLALDPVEYRGMDARRVVLTSLERLIAGLGLALVVGRLMAASGLLEAWFGPTWADQPTRPLFVALLAGGLLVLVYGYSAPRLAFDRYYRGLRLLQAGQDVAARVVLDRQLAEIRRRPGPDRWRSALLLDTGLYSFTEMTLLNLAVAHARLGEPEAADTYLRDCLAHNPQNSVASALRRIVAASVAQDEPPAGHDPGRSGGGE